VQLIVIRTVAPAVLPGNQVARPWLVWQICWLHELNGVSVLAEEFQLPNRGSTQLKLSRQGGRVDMPFGKHVVEPVETSARTSAHICAAYTCFFKTKA